MRRVRPAQVLFTLAFLTLPLSVASAKKCEKDYLEIKIRCDPHNDERDKTLFVVAMTTYNYVDPDNGKPKDEYTRPEMHQASACLGTENTTLGFRIKDRACDGKDLFANISYCKLTKAEYEEAGKPANVYELCKKLKKSDYYLPPYRYDANKEPTSVLTFKSTGPTLEAIKK